jgi:hypothetical protein
MTGVTSIVLLPMTFLAEGPLNEDNHTGRVMRRKACT